MKLAKFNTSNMSGGERAGQSLISFNAKGANTISQKAVTEMGLMPGDRIAILQDEDEPSDWYLAIDGEDGFKLRDTGKNSKALAFNNCAMAKAIIDCFSEEDKEYKGVTFKLSTTPTEADLGGGVYHCALRHYHFFSSL